jgi:hypothetical protein
VIDQNVLAITASSVTSPQSHPIRQVVDFESQVSFYTQNQVNSWICFDFKDMRIGVRNYSVRSRCDYNGNHLRFWCLEGSNDGVNWVGIDERVNDGTLNSAGAVATFGIEEGFREEFRMVRIRQTGKNSSGNLFLQVSAIEFYGFLNRSED